MGSSWVPVLLLVDQLVQGLQSPLDHQAVVVAAKRFYCLHELILILTNVVVNSCCFVFVLFMDFKVMLRVLIND